MTKPTPKNIAASVHQRLLNQAKATARPFGELLQYFAIERFLYRLSASAHADEFILKGALMLRVWDEPLTRPTMDIDLLGRVPNRLEAIVSIVRDVCQVPTEPDGLVFDPDSVHGEQIVQDAEYEGVRVRFRGHLATARIAMQLDVGFGDVVVPSDEPVVFPPMLDFSGPRLRGYTKESFIAEKFETMIRFGVLNSRMKDFYDVWALCRRFNFDGRRLAAAIRETFTTRGTNIPPQPEPFTPAFAEDAMREAQWDGFARKSRLDCGQVTFEQMVGVLSSFLYPIAEALAAGRGFDQIWTAPGAWSQRHEE